MKIKFNDLNEALPAINALANTETRSDSKAQTTLTEMIVSSINNLNPDRQNPLMIVRSAIEQSRTQLQAQIKHWESSISRHEKFCKRIIRNNGKENFLTQSLQHGIEMMRKQIAECVLNIAMGEEMLVILDEFQYDLPKQQPLPTAWGALHSQAIFNQGEPP